MSALKIQGFKSRQSPLLIRFRRSAMHLVCSREMINALEAAYGKPGIATPICGLDAGGALYYP